MEFKKTKDFLVCVDSDGCMLDNMELKHKECFTPATVNVWNLQGVSKYAREVCDFVNLYSLDRGINRFPSILKTLELLSERKEVVERGIKFPDLEPLREWIKTTKTIDGIALNEYCRNNPDCPEILRTAARWSDEVNENTNRIVRNVLPFPHVKEALGKIKEFANIFVVSGAPSAVIKRELTETGLIDYVDVVNGQEYGTKATCIHNAMAYGYSPDKTMKIGDAPSDYKAACANGVFFNPIVAGKEAESWGNIATFSADCFRNGTFAEKCQKQLLDEFYSRLDVKIPWEVVSKQ